MINENLLREFVGSKIFNIEFIKKNGAIRTMNARFGVSKGVTGNGPRKPGHLITVFDMNANAFRCFNNESVLRVKCNGVTFKF